MDDLANRIERMLKPMTDAKLRELGGVPDANGVWTFPDRSQGKFTERPIAVYADENQTKLLGYSYFEKIDRIH